MFQQNMGVVFPSVVINVGQSLNSTVNTAPYYTIPIKEPMAQVVSTSPSNIILTNNTLQVVGQSNISPPVVTNSAAQVMSISKVPQFAPTNHVAQFLPIVGGGITVEENMEFCENDESDDILKNNEDDAFNKVADKNILPVVTSYGSISYEQLCEETLKRKVAVLMQRLDANTIMKYTKKYIPSAFSDDTDISSDSSQDKMMSYRNGPNVTTGPRVPKVRRFFSKNTQSSKTLDKTQSSKLAKHLPIILQKRPVYNSDNVISDNKKALETNNKTLEINNLSDECINNIQKSSKSYSKKPQEIKRAMGKNLGIYDAANNSPIPFNRLANHKVYTKNRMKCPPRYVLKDDIFPSPPVNNQKDLKDHSGPHTLTLTSNTEPSPSQCRKKLRRTKQHPDKESENKGHAAKYVLSYIPKRPTSSGSISSNDAAKHALAPTVKNSSLSMLSCNSPGVNVNSITEDKINNIRSSSASAISSAPSKEIISINISEALSTRLSSETPTVTIKEEPKDIKQEPDDNSNVPTSNPEPEPPVTNEVKVEEPDKDAQNEYYENVTVPKPLFSEYDASIPNITEWEKKFIKESTRSFFIRKKLLDTFESCDMESPTKAKEFFTLSKQQMAAQNVQIKVLQHNMAKLSSTFKRMKTLAEL